jgi:hypothetical protein
MNGNDRVEAALRRRPTDERIYDEPVRALAEGVVEPRARRARSAAPALAGLCLVALLAVSALAAVPRILGPSGGQTETAAESGPSASPTSLGSGVQIQQAGSTRIYLVADSTVWIEPSAFELQTGWYSVSGSCSGRAGAAGQATLQLQQISQGNPTSEPYHATCGPVGSTEGFGEMLLLTGGSYRLVIASNTARELTFQIGPVSSGPELPAGTAAPEAPSQAQLVAIPVPCPGASTIDASSPCVTYALSWLRPDDSSFYRIYEGTAIAADYDCSPEEANPIILTAGAVDAAQTGTYASSGYSRLCLYVTAVNSAGESAKVAFGGVRNVPIEPARTFTTYRVKSGDTLGGIAARFGLTLDQLLAANPQIDTKIGVFVGQIVYIPWQDWAPTLKPPPAPTVTPHS